jgi:hypothetical protein
MSNLRLSAKCGSDGFDQSCGIPSALPRPWGVKQGWSGFGAAPAPGEECVESSQPSARVRAVLSSPEVRDAAAKAPGEGATTKAVRDIDITSRAMHTSGTVGANDEKIVVVLTLEPTTLSWNDSADRITDLTEAVYTGTSKA